MAFEKTEELFACLLTKQRRKDARTTVEVWGFAYIVRMNCGKSFPKELGQSVSIYTGTCLLKVSKRVLVDRLTYIGLLPVAHRL